MTRAAPHDPRKRLRPLLAALSADWGEQYLRYRWATDRRNAPVLLFAHWLEDATDPAEAFLTILVHVHPRAHSMIVFAQIRNQAAELIDMKGSEHHNRGLGTLALAFLDEIACELGAETIEGWLSPVDLDHRPRQVHFYEKNGYTVWISEDRSEGRIVKRLRCGDRSLS